MIKDLSFMDIKLVQQLGKVMNEDLRIEIVKREKHQEKITYLAHSVDILDHLYGKVLNVRPDEPDWEEEIISFCRKAMDVVHFMLCFISMVFLQTKT